MIVRAGAELVKAMPPAAGAMKDAVRCGAPRIRVAQRPVPFADFFLCLAMCLDATWTCATAHRHLLRIDLVGLPQWVVNECRYHAGTARHHYRVKFQKELS